MGAQPKAKPDYLEISITVFSRMTGKLPFDVYIRRAESAFTKLYPRNEEIDPAHLKKYQNEKGVSSLFVHQTQYGDYLICAEKVAVTIFQDLKSITAEQLLDLLKEVVNLTMLDMMFNLNVDQKSVSQATQTVRGCISLLARDKKSFIQLFKLMARHPYMIKHAVSSSCLALMLGQMEKLESDKSLFALGLGALLHDLGMAMLPFDAELKQELTPDEWKAMKEHPALGKRLLDNVPVIGPEVRQIVMEHHEQPNGAGYPNNLHNHQIFYLAKIVAIADSFSALVSHRPYREQPCHPYRAIELMQEDRGKFDPKLLESLKKLFTK